jgi:olfactory receptor
MLVNIQEQNKGISYSGCLSQVYFLIIFSGMDNFLLSMMAFDHFVAICHLLNYMVIMNPHSVAFWFWYHGSLFSGTPCFIFYWLIDSISV